MNLPVYTTDTLYLDRCHTESVLESFIHTVLFHRVIYKQVKPKEATNPIYDTLHYVMMDDDVLHRMVKEKIETVIQSLKEKKTGTVSVLFFCNKDSGGWFSKTEKVIVERWSIPIQWYELYDKSHSASHKERNIKRVYESLLGMLCTASVPVYSHVKNDIPFDIVDLDNSSRLTDLIQFIISGPPKLGIF